MPVGNGEAFRLRGEAGLTSGQVGRASGVSVSTVKRFERGDSLKIKTVFAIAAGLSELLDRYVDPNDLLIDDRVDAASPNVITATGIKFKTLAFGQRLADVIDATGSSVNQLAEETGLSPRTLNRVLEGEVIVSRLSLMRILEALEIDRRETEELLARREKLTPQKATASPPPDSSDEKEERKVTKLRQAAISIPNQNDLVRFGVSENAKLDLKPTLKDQNDYDTIEALRSELLASDGPIEQLQARYAQGPNVPQASLFGPLTTKYAEELSKDLKEINFTILFARGSRFYTARKRAADQIALGEWPELDAHENEAIDAVCEIHGAMIMASAAGRKLVEDARQYEVPPEVYEEDKKVIAEFGEVIAAEVKLVEPETADAYREITSAQEGDPQPARSRGLGIAAIGSALSVFVGAAAWYGAGGAAASLIVPAAALGATGLAGGFLWEAVKSMPSFKKASGEMGEQFENVLDKAREYTNDKEQALLKNMSDLVDRKHKLFEKVANLRPEFEWAKRYIKSSKNEADAKADLVTEDAASSGGTVLNVCSLVFDIRAVSLARRNSENRRKFSDSLEHAILLAKKNIQSRGGKIVSLRQHGFVARFIGQKYSAPEPDNQLPEEHALKAGIEICLAVGSICEELKFELSHGLELFGPVVGIHSDPNTLIEDELKPILLVVDDGAELMCSTASTMHLQVSNSCFERVYIKMNNPLIQKFTRQELMSSGTKDSPLGLYAYSLDVNQL